MSASPPIPVVSASPPRPSNQRPSCNSKIPLPPGMASGIGHSTGGGVGTGEASSSKRRSSLSLGVSGPVYSAPANSRLSLEGTDDVDERLPVEVQNRLLRAALRIARADAAESSISASNAHSQLLELNKAASAAATERVQLQRAVKAAEEALAKARKAVNSAEVREAEARAEAEVARREAREAPGRERLARGGDGDAVRLARALEDVEKLRASLAQERSLASEVSGAHRRELETFQTGLRRAEKQRVGE